MKKKWHLILLVFSATALGGCSKISGHYVQVEGTQGVESSQSTVGQSGFIAAWQKELQTCRKDLKPEACVRSIARDMSLVDDPRLKKFMNVPAPPKSAAKTERANAFLFGVLLVRSEGIKIALQKPDVLFLPCVTRDSLLSCWYLGLVIGTAADPNEKQTKYKK